MLFCKYIYFKVFQAEAHDVFRNILYLPTPPEIKGLKTEPERMEQ